MATLRNTSTLWILDSDEATRALLRSSLDLRFHLREFVTVASFRQALIESVESPGATPPPDLVLTELRLPDLSFLDFLRAPDDKILLRGKSFMVLSSVDDIDLLRLCFQEGACDYLTKPLKKNELIAKIERCLPVNRSDAAMGALCVDPVRMTASLGGMDSCSLTSKEFQILMLLNQSDAAVKREDLVDRVWQQSTVSKKTIDIHIFNLRRKLRGLGLKIQLHPSGTYLLTRCQ